MNTFNGGGKKAVGISDYRTVGAVLLPASEFSAVTLPRFVEIDSVVANGVCEAVISPEKLAVSD